MSVRTHIIIGLLVLIVPSLMVAAQNPTQPSFLIIVNPKNEVTSLDKKFLLDTFLKKVTRWGNNEVIKPVDLEPKSTIRHNFSQSVLKRSVAEVKNYWQQRIFAGYDLPPPELNKDSDIVQYVLKYPGAIGYVSSEADVSGAKVISVK